MLQDQKQHVEEEDGNETETHEFDSVAQSRGEKKPLEGKVICLTGLREQRVRLITILVCTPLANKPSQTELCNCARSMGAVIELALTLDVTHLLADAVNSPKYKVCLVHSSPIRMNLTQCVL